MISNTPGWVVWHRHPSQLSHNWNARLAESEICTQKKLIALFEKANIDREVLRLFFQRCMEHGRSLYLDGFRREGIELMSIAWNRGYTEHSGPLLERVLASYFGTKVTLSARRFISELKRSGLRDLAAASGLLGHGSRIERN